MEARELEKKEGIYNIKVMIMWTHASWLKFFPNFVLYVKLEDMCYSNLVTSDLIG
jgi:hypothetical protein